MVVEYSEKALDILTAARDLFAEKGFTSSTTKEIAKKAGVNEVTIFRYFKTKENLFEAVFENFYFRPDYSHFENIEEGNLNIFLLEAGHFFHSIFLKNINLLLIGLRESSIMETKTIIDKFLNEMVIRMEDYVIKTKSCTKAEAEIFCITFISSVFGILFNLYVFKTFKTGATFDECLEMLVTKYE